MAYSKYSAAVVDTLARGTLAAGLTTEAERDVTPGIFRFQPEATPLTVLSLLSGNGRQIEEPMHEWFEKERRPDCDVLNGAVATGDVVITPANPQFYIAGDVLLVGETEQMYVSATPAYGATTIAVNRATGTVSSQAFPVGAHIFRISTSFLENTTSGDMLTVDAVPIYNYAAIDKTPWGISDTMKNSRTFTASNGDAEAQFAEDALMEHKLKQEKVVLLGQKGIKSGSRAASTQNQWFTAGMDSYISSNVVQLNGELTPHEFHNFLRISNFFKSSAGVRKLLVASPMVCQIISEMALGKIRPSEVFGKFGANVTEYTIAGNTVNILCHPMLMNYDLNDISGMAGWAYIIDLPNFKILPYKGRMMQYNPKAQENDRDGVKRLYTSQFTVEVANEKMFGKLMGAYS